VRPPSVNRRPPMMNGGMVSRQILMMRNVVPQMKQIAIHAIHARRRVPAEGGCVRAAVTRRQVYCDFCRMVRSRVPSTTTRRRTRLANDAFARLFEALHEGVYIGLVKDDSTATLAANPHLRLMFGWAEDDAVSEVRPFDVERFVDDVARASFLQQLARDGAAVDYLLRVRRVDGTAMWVEVTARAEPLAAPSESASRARGSERGWGPASAKEKRPPRLKRTAAGHELES
jgi:PAS domain-containing protein